METGTEFSKPQITIEAVRNKGVRAISIQFRRALGNSMEGPILQSQNRLYSVCKIDSRLQLRLDLHPAHTLAIFLRAGLRKIESICRVTSSTPTVPILIRRVSGITPSF